VENSLDSDTPILVTYKGLVAFSEKEMGEIQTHWPPGPHMPSVQAFMICAWFLWWQLKAVHILFLFKFKQKHALYARCSGSVVRPRKPLSISSASGPFFTINTLSYHFLSATLFSMPVHLEKQQTPHHVITTAALNNRNQVLYMGDSSSS
jgi:hypothetical protein